MIYSDASLSFTEQLIMNSRHTWQSEDYLQLVDIDIL